MKVTLVMYTGGGLSGGARKYLRRMVPLLLDDEAISELRVLLPQGAMTEIPDSWPVTEWPAGKFRGREIRKLIAEEPCDVAFIPTARWVDPGAAASVVMVRNMEPLEPLAGAPKLVDRVKRMVHRAEAWRACAKADRIIAVSDYVANWLTSNWAVGRAKLAVIPHGVDSPQSGEPPSGASTLAGRRFVFSAGSIRPARGLTDLIEAMGHEAFPADLDLAFAGKPDADAWEYHASLLERVARLGLQDRVHWLGQCTSREMAWGFANCALFVMTSRAEACPNTVLEALANGCLAVSCDTAPMPEFFGSAALYYAAGDPASLADAARRALALSEAERERLGTASRERAAGYSWKRCAQDTVALLAEAAQAHGAGRRQST